MPQQNGWQERGDATKKDNAFIPEVDERRARLEKELVKLHGIIDSLTAKNREHANGAEQAKSLSAMMVLEFEALRKEFKKLESENIPTVHILKEVKDKTEVISQEIWKMNREVIDRCLELSEVQESIVAKRKEAKREECMVNELKIKTASARNEWSEVKENVKQLKAVGQKELERIKEAQRAESEERTRVTEASNQIPIILQNFKDMENTLNTFFEEMELDEDDDDEVSICES